MRTVHRRSLRALAAAAVVCLSASAPSLAATFNLRADEGTLTMPDGRVVPVWGFALDAGPVTVPGPQLVLLPGDTNLTINLTNNLPQPVSIVIPGLTKTMVPVFDGGTPPRVLSFDTEAPPAGGTAAYSFSNVRPGTFIYESGRDPAQQVQMGLYGALIARPSNAGRAYSPSSTAFTNELVMVISEIDPAFHDAVQNNCYAPNGPTDPGCATVVTSTIDYAPKYYLINGAPYSDPYTPFSGGTTGSTTLIRLVNAGLQTHTMTLQGTRMEVIGENANLLGFARTGRVSEAIAAGQTLDILIRPQVPGKYAFFARTLGVTNAGTFPGGLIAFIDVVGAPNQAPNGVIDNPSGNVTINAGASVSFQGTGTDPDNNTPLTYLWDMGGGAANRTVEDPGSTTFNTPGTYTVTFTVTDSLVLSDPTPATRVITVNSCSATVDRRVSAGSDDAEQGGSSVSLNSSDIELVQDGSSSQTVGLRFANITIPQGRTILSAYIQFQADEDQNGTAFNLTLQAQAADNAPTFTSSSNNISSRARVGSVPWVPLAWTTGQAGASQRTPDIKSLIQAVVNRGGWASGNALAIIVTGTGGSSANHRTAEAFEGLAAAAPLLHIEYDCPGGGGGNQAPNGVINTPPGNVTITQGQSVNFTGTANDPDNNTPLTYLWNMGGGASNRTVEDPGNVTFNTAGTFTVTFTVRDSQNLPDPTPDSRVITVNPTAATTLERRVAGGSDDAEQKGSSVDLSSSDLELVYDGQTQSVGLRFTNITIPQGRTILNAYIQFQADEQQTGTTNVTLQAQASDNAPTFTTSSNNISSRSTVGSVAWSSIPQWNTIGEAGTGQRTVDIKSLIQAVVNRSGWGSGNALVIIITGTGGSSSSHRTAESFEGSSGAAPLLHVEY